MLLRASFLKLINEQGDTFLHLPHYEQAAKECPSLH